MHLVLFAFSVLTDLLIHANFVHLLVTQILTAGSEVQGQDVDMYWKPCDKQHALIVNPLFFAVSKIRIFCLFVFTETFSVH